MPQYNSLQRVGTLITDPCYLFWLEVAGLEPPAECQLGDFLAIYTAQEIIGYLAMRGWAVTIQGQASWIERHKPVLVMKIVETGEERRFDHNGYEISRVKPEEVTEI